MSQRLIKLNPDLRRLRDNGYNVEERSGYLLVRDVPYVNAQREIRRGILTAHLQLANDRTQTPDHVAFFAGDHPCNADGSEIVQIKHSSSERKIDNDFSTQHSFSSQPEGGYKDYYDMMTTYVAIIANPARAIDSKITAQTNPVYEDDEDDDSPFVYTDTASSRADIVPVTKKLELSKVAILGVGGTGSYVLDLIAKTPIREIHLFDGDKLLQHNAFRAPGAPSLAELEQTPFKVEHFKGQYSKMHRGIIAHPYYLTQENVDELTGTDFAFICMDGGEGKRQAIEKLEELGIPFVDVGMGIQVVDDSLIGIAQLTTSTQRRQDHVRTHVDLSADEGNNEYARNIQIADLNALNAALAVIKWKKLLGFYKDMEDEHYCSYTVDGNLISNSEKP